MNAKNGSFAAASLVAETPEVLQHSTRESHRNELSGIRVLVVEDVEDARETARAMFEHLGADVLVAADGQDALDVLQNEEVDIIFCDLRMPNMDATAGSSDGTTCENECFDGSRRRYAAGLLR